MSKESAKYFWKIEDLFNESGSDINFALLILNQPILSTPELVISLWKRAAVRITVDGGSDRWLQFCQVHELNLIPDLITGDLDSVQKETLAHYKSLGTSVIHTPDQDETDFTKALKETAAWFAQKRVEPHAVISLVETSGRIDQIMANINTLFKSHAIIKCPVYQLASNSISWLLDKGHHQMIIPRSYNNKICSLVPIGNPALSVSSSGLKWNLDNQGMKFGELISTSNMLTPASDGLVTVATDSVLMWSIELN
ncbi:thiamin pyrophosphokinase 1 [Neocloeon triangulifer]|uniref:thiamin pyrophosphokinase 1 n=1 Tax=Neocloeon triangulifer TaxID=2078957 RepID=UPI00286EBB10|nr:thiamin pyrophosphokinase 1 [Neocloeon triangulifer]